MARPIAAARQPRAADLFDFIPSEAGVSTGPFARYLRSEGKAKTTIDKYLLIVRQLGVWLAREGLATNVVEIQKAHVQDYIAESLATKKSSTANTRFYALRAFFSYLLADEEIRWHPMDGMKPPPAPAPAVPVIPAEHVQALIKTCKTNGLIDRRDAALLMLFYDTGVRVSEMSGMALDDLGDGWIKVVGKGSKPRVVHFGATTARVLDRYLRLRDRHDYADTPALWLGLKGPMTRWGMRDVLERRAKLAGVPHIHPHQFRHTFAHEWLADGGQENDLMRLTGWSSRSMVGRYAASAADARAAESYKKRQSPADKLRGK